MVRKKEPLELLLSEEKTKELVKKLTDYYGGLETIQDYFLDRKKEKIINLEHENYIGSFFDDYNMEPKDMDISVEVIPGKLFNPSAQLIISLPLESQIGRQITLGVKENKTGKWVGFIRLASPVLSIKPRNDIFVDRLDAKQVNKHMYNGSIIVPVQPFGYNYLGGKLLALICASHYSLDLWKEKYGDKVEPCFMETTSLYGDIKGVSQYDGLKPFMRYGSMTESDLFLFPNESLYKELRDYLRGIYGKEEWGGNLVDPKPSGPKMREFNKIISILKNHLKSFDFDSYEVFHKFTKEKMKAKTKKRFYYSTFGYDNVVEHIKSNGDIELRKRDNFDRFKLESVIEFWRNKAQRRYTKLKEDGRLRSDLEVYTSDTIDNYDKKDMVR